VFTGSGAEVGATVTLFDTNGTTTLRRRRRRDWIWMRRTIRDPAAQTTSPGTRRGSLSPVAAKTAP
jgi:hypothetical protein